jgi:hypothetical protein
MILNEKLLTLIKELLFASQQKILPEAGIITEKLVELEKLSPEQCSVYGQALHDSISLQSANMFEAVIDSLINRILENEIQYRIKIT